MSSRAVKGRHNIRKKNGKAVVLAILAVIIALFIALFVGATALASSWLEDLPDYSNMNDFGTSKTSVVYASDGETVLAEFQLENRDPVELDQISPYVLEGTVATEDERFYSHSGVDLYGTSRALVNNLVGGALEGGSTITQQLIRNTILSEEMSEISFKRKLREMYLATEMEKEYSKSEILLMYLNTINYGSGAYGIEAAAQRYFSKPAIDLTLNEAATLIGIPQSPTYNNPIDHMDSCKSRRNTVLDRMVSNSVITQEEADAVKAEDIVLNPTAPSNTGILAYPYFTSYVRNQLLNQEGKYALSVSDLFAGGLEIVTTLDISAQQAADAASETKRNQAGNGFECAIVAVEPENGYIRAMVGGSNYDENQVNMATGEGSSGRQAGSSFKPFTLAAALEAGISPDTLIDAGYSVTPDGAPTVHNASMADYGARSIASAFAVSSNTAFTRLILSIGVDKVKDMAQRLGITSNIQDVAGITLGIDSVTPLEMADAYATIANGGTHYDPECIISITDRSGNVVFDNAHPEGERVISEEIAYATTQVMEGVITEGTGTAARLATAQPVAGKTGTTETVQDSWFVGFTPYISVAVWVGDPADSYEKARRVPVTAASAFADFMNRYHDGKEIRDFPVADEPDYDESYTDIKNHIGSGGWSPTTDPNAEEEEEEPEEPSTEEPEEPEEPSGGETPDPPPTTPDPPPSTGGEDGGTETPPAA